MHNDCKKDNIHYLGPGVFIAAAVSKQGGSSELTFVNLDIDGKNVSSMSFVAAENLGLIEHNPYGIVLLKSSSIRTFTIVFPSPLRFERELQLMVTVNEAGIDQIVANIIHGTD
jgi:hypothetical protein